MIYQTCKEDVSILGTKVESYYQQLAELIVETIPEEWIEVKFYGQEDEGHRKVFFYYLSKETNEWVYNMTIPEKFQVSEEKFDALRRELSFCVGDLKIAYQEEFGESWISFQMVLQHTGKFNIAFYYEKNPFDPLLTQIAWQYEHFGTVSEEGSFYNDLLNEYLEEKAQGKRYPFLEPLKEE